jgi:serpin B
MHDAGKLIAANNDFGFRLLTWLADQDAGENVFISSFSVAMALTMVYNGAEGRTKETLAELLGLSGLDLQQINEANAGLVSPTDLVDPKVQLLIANSIWLRNGITPSSDFTQRIRDYYAGEVATLDFARADAAATINRWVAGKTRNMISQIVTPLALRKAILVLINAIYFKGLWSEPFDKKLTKESPFYKLDGSSKPCRMMAQSDHYDYYESDEFQAVSLPYGTGRISMYIFLPKPPSSIRDFQQRLSSSNWERWLHEFYAAAGDIRLPRFKIEYANDLLESLKALGGEEIGDEDFISMGAGPLIISRVIHKAVVEVNEEGTTAAAVTAVAMTRGGRIGKWFAFTVDRPFFVAIRDNQTGALLFTGFVFDPTE